MDNLLKMMSDNNWHDIERASRSFGDRLADTMADFVGSWTFIILHTIWFVAWFIFDVEPFPFGLLTLIVSLEAIMLSTFIMMAQNRAIDRDRVQAQADYKTNLDAKKEIEEIQRKLGQLEIEKLDKILEILKK